MMINPPEDWKMPESEQAENKHRTSTEQVAEQVRTLVLSIGKDQLTLKQMMEKMNLKHLIPSIPSPSPPEISSDSQGTCAI